MNEEIDHPVPEAPQEEIKPTPTPRRFNIIKFEKRVRAVTAILARFAGLVLLIVALIFIYKELTDTSYSIQHISVPVSFEDAGLSGAVVANLLSDKMEEIIKVLQENEETAQYINSIDRPDIQVDMVGMGVPVRAVIGLIGDALGIHKAKRISGDILLDGDTAILVLRITGHQAERFRTLVRASRETAVLHLVNEASEAILKFSDPWILGIYYTNVKRDGPKAVALGKYMTDNHSGDPKIIKASYANWAFGLLFERKLDAAEKKVEEGIKKFPDDSGLHNIWGVVLSEEGHDKEAIVKYKKAMQLFTEKESTANRRNQIYTNIGVSFAYLGNYDSSMYYFQKALALNKDDWLVLFNISNIYLYKADTTNFYEYFSKAFEKGMEPDFVNADPDLKRELGEKRVKELIRKYGKE